MQKCQEVTEHAEKLRNANEHEQAARSAEGQDMLHMPPLCNAGIYLRPRMWAASHQRIAHPHGDAAHDDRRSTPRRRWHRTFR
jgi:hypothetical protein